MFSILCKYHKVLDARARGAEADACYAVSGYRAPAKVVSDHRVLRDPGTSHHAISGGGATG